MKPRVLVVLGPTATGKTDLGIFLAKKFNGEIISADSRQVYKGLDIGTGKLPSKKQETRNKKQMGKGFWIVNGVKIWLYDVEDPKVQYSVKDYIVDATKAIMEVSDRGKLPIIVGGSGLYIKGLLFGIDYLEVPINEKLREELSKKSLEELQKRVEELSPPLFRSLNSSEKGNKRRLIRKIELISMNPYIDTFDQSPVNNNTHFDSLMIGLTAPRVFINSSIDARLTSRLNSGLVAESQRLRKEGVTLKRMRELGLEYGMLADLLEEKVNELEFDERLKNKIHQYAKRQMTYLKKIPGIKWFDITSKKYPAELEKVVLGWYNGSHVQTD